MCLSSLRSRKRGFSRGVSVFFWVFPSPRRGVGNHVRASATKPNWSSNSFLITSREKFFTTPTSQKSTPRKRPFRDLREDIYISSEGRKGEIFHTETGFFSSRHPFPHENQAKPPVRVRKWMSRTEKKCRGVKNPPFCPSGRNVFICSQVPKRGVFEGGSRFFSRFRSPPKSSHLWARSDSFHTSSAKRKESRPEVARFWGGPKSRKKSRPPSKTPLFGI